MEGHFGARQVLDEGAELAVPGWWEVELVVRRRGRIDVSTAFPLRLPSPERPSDPEALALLRAAEEASAALGSWVEHEQLTDGAGNVVRDSSAVRAGDRISTTLARGRIESEVKKN